MAKLLIERLVQLKRCTLPHGNKGNSATVYGHDWPRRNCIRLAGSKTWVYDPGWEQPGNG